MLKRLLALSVISLFLSHASLAGPNQDALKAFQDEISQESYSLNNQLGSSPFCDSAKLWTLRQVLHAIPVDRETLVINRLPGYRTNPSTEVNAEALAGLFLPVAGRLHELEQDGSKENQRRLAQAVTRFERAMLELPDVNEAQNDTEKLPDEDEEDSEKYLEKDDQEGSEERGELSEDDGLIFRMDDDDTQADTVEGFGVEPPLQNDNALGVDLRAFSLGAGGSFL